MHDYSPVYARSDLVGRFTSFFEHAGPLGIVVVLLGGLLLLSLALFGRRRELMFLLILCATFSGAMWTAVDSGSTMIRWLVLALLALNILRLRVHPGTPILFFLIYTIIGIGFIAFSPVMDWSLQIGGLQLLTVLAAISLSDMMLNRADIRRVLYLFLISASAWFVMAFVTLPQLAAARQEAGRHSGVITSAPLFVITGGLLLVIAVWGALCSRKTWQCIICGVLGLSLVLLLLASGQRTGTYAGIMGCTPLLIRRKLNSMLFVGLACVLVGLLGVRLVSANKGQVEFLKKRYMSVDNSGRTKIWTNAFKECMRSPIIGRGHGGDRAFGVKYHHPTHNSCLSVWYNTGIFGLGTFLGAFAVAAFQCWRLIRHGRDQEIRDMGRVLLGLLIAEFAAGSFETSTSPSNFATITLAILFVIIGRLSIISKEEAQYEAHARTTRLRYVWVPALPVRPGMATSRPVR